MNKRLQSRLYQKYPKIFSLVLTESTDGLSCMKEGISCDDGWYELLDNLCHSIQYHIDNPPHVIDDSFVGRIGNLWNKIIWNKIFHPLFSKFSFEVYQRLYKYSTYSPIYHKIDVKQVVALQIKEKFGTLRFYYQGGDDYISSIVHYSESLSSKLCECCGKFDKEVKTRDRGNGTCLVKTLCARCHKNWRRRK